MNEMCLISLRDIIDDTYEYTYKGKLPQKYVPAYNTIIDLLGLDIKFQGVITEDCPKTLITQGMKAQFEYEMFGYRRCKIRDYLKANYDCMITTSGIVEAKYIIVSDPRVAIIELIEKLTLGDDAIMIYDKTDNWGSLNEFSDKLDKLCLEYADIITYSAHGLIPIGYESKSHYVPNGNNIYSLDSSIEKYSTPTAIYAGNNIEKFNGKLLYILAVMYPDWNFKVYINHNANTEPCMMHKPDNVTFYMPIAQEELFKEIQKCHVGLLLFYNQAWETGMMPLKLFNYINAEIPTLYTSGLENNLKDYGEVSFSISEYELDELLNVKVNYDKYKRSWDDVLKELFEVWEIKG